MDDQTELLGYFQRELAYLRHSGGTFARQYPKVAQRLEISDQESPDPHVERLLESFAFLTGRLQYNIDREFPEVPAALLDVLYPHFTAPLPSMTIARFDVDPEQGKMVGGYTVDSGTPLFADTNFGQPVRFRTCYPVTLWPLAVREAVFEPAARHEILDRMPEAVTVLRLRIETTAPEGTVGELNLDKLRFCLSGDRPTAFAVYELLSTALEAIVVTPDTGAPTVLSGDTLRPVGFGLDEAVLPFPPSEHQSYRLLQEYFSFPDKFLFLDATDLERATASAERYFDLLLVLNERPALPLSIDADTFALGCTPVVNLFPKTSEPIRLDETRPEYRLVPDQRLEWMTEVHTILKVTATADSLDESKSYAPFFSYEHASENADQRAFWLARRRLSERSDLHGTDVFLSFLDLDFTPRQPPDRTMFAHLLCTNRAAAEQLPANALLSVEEDLPIRRIVATAKPTRQVAPPLSGQTLWRLVSHLSVNHLSLTGSQGLKALKEILRLYGFVDQRSVDQQIAGLVGMNSRKAVRRVGEDAWRGFVRGWDVTIDLEPRMFTGGSAFLFASVIERFLASYATLNSFVQTSARRGGRDEIWKTWPPTAGEQALL